DIIKYGITQIAYLGISSAEIDSRLAETKGIKNLNGVYIVSILDIGSAKEAGLKEGDIIIQISGKDINYNSELNEVLAQSSPGDKIMLKFEREGKIYEKELTLLNENGNTSIVKEEEKNMFTVLNAELREISSKEKKEYGVENGFMIEKLNNSQFARLGLKKSFVITSIDKNPNIRASELKQLNTKKGKVIIEGFYPNDYRRYYFILVL
ncbi:MAG: PDZ domain-containing protein, partial [Bacteroidales bacterium]|nr:PDZ domain-containing protein [Bacteroidales bacterium]